MNRKARQQQQAFKIVDRQIKTGRHEARWGMQKGYERVAWFYSMAKETRAAEWSRLRSLVTGKCDGAECLGINQASA